MKERAIDIALIQETWMENDFTLNINDYQLIYYGLKLMKSSRNERGVAIISSPPMIEAYQANNEEPPLTSSLKDEIDSGRFISINIKLDIKFRQSKGAFKNK